MAFKLKSVSEVFGINEEASEYGTPVFEKNLDPGVMGEANRDGTIFVKKGLSQKEINKAVAHEKVHLDQMKQGRLDYDNETVTWKPTTKSPARVYKRANMMEGAKNLPWEKEAYNKTKE
jgi:hypothetical protein|tara:strand:+ start:56 stop:412 length:357 start_codon:yes stop_codon:yes gene_type:complete